METNTYGDAGEVEEIRAQKKVKTLLFTSK